MPEDYQNYEEANTLLTSLKEGAGKTGLYAAQNGIESDPWRRLLIDVIYHFGHSITEERPEKGKIIELHIDPLIRCLRELDRMQDHDRTIMIRTRETFFSGQRTASKTDYTISFGNISLDSQGVESMAGRAGENGQQLLTRMAIAFERLARYQIRSLYIEIPRESPEDIDRIRLSLRILSSFHHALQSKVPVYYTEGEFQRPITIVTDRNDQPNPNLTLLAAMNHVKPDLIKGFIHGIEDFTRRPRSSTPYPDISGMYSTLFAIRKTIEKLKVPPFEINNGNRVAFDRIMDTVCHEKAGVIRLIEVVSGDIPREGARILETIYGSDYDRIDARNLAGRLLTVSELIETAEKNGAGSETLREIRGNLGERLRSVPDSVMDRIDISGNDIRVLNGVAQTGSGAIKTSVQGQLCASLTELVRFHRGRSATRQKIRGLLNGPAVFDASDYGVVAQEYGISPENSARLLNLVGECFDKTGRFQIAAFDKRIESLTAYAGFILFFLWNILADVMAKENRPAFLSALQHLAARTGQPRAMAIKLISDLSGDPDQIHAADRNALMLATLLARTHARELQIDTEVTPEEILSAPDEINRDVAGAVCRRIEADRKSFFRKMRTVDRFTAEFLDEQEPAPLPVTLPFMLALRREALICLALIGGETAFSVIRAGVRELGDPEAAIHHLKKSPSVRPQLLSLLQTGIRSLGKTGRKEDAALLRQIATRADNFEAFNRTDARHVERVQRIMKWAEKIAGELEG